ncbi:MAG: TonB-dependent receptor [Gloeobacteraceae cyanobacterium ES-bin-144]|nr:TonB-dependent receptor [Verrucomicrobiales bacterium]
MTPNSYDKALDLNLDPKIYGAFAEIGAGQETANWFFRASGTAGLVAKTISAYDMTMSDAIYGRAERYVSADRLGSMLDHEYAILLERLGPKRGKDTTFFSFCNTVRARGYNDSGECHGWLGIRFQMKPGDPPSEIILHVRLLDHRTIDQMEALGIVGLNLIHSAFRQRAHLKKFVESLSDNLVAGRVEVDLLKFSGNGYGFFDNRLCALQLVESGLTDATMFLPNGEVVQPAEVLYRHPVLLLRGSFDPVMNLHLAMLENAREGFSKSLAESDRGSEIELCEISMHNLLRSSGIDPVDFLDRSDALQSLGKTVLVSRCAEFHRIAAFLNRCTNKPVGIILSIGLLNELFKAKWSENLAGGLLESFGRLFKEGVTLQVFPWKNRKTAELVTAETFSAPENCVHLYQHFVENGRIQGISCGNESLLAHTGRDVCRMILANNPEWRKLVPEVAWPMAERHAQLSPG